MRRCSFPLIVFLLLAVCPGAANGADAPRVVVSIAPVHSLLASVMQGIAKPTLLVPPGQSPHVFALAPSDAHALSRANLVVTSGGEADRFLQRSLDALAANARRTSLLQSDGVTLLPARSGGAWQPDHGHTGQHENLTAASNRTDPHAWLDPRNAIAFARTSARELAAIDPAHADRYRANAEALAKQLAKLDETIARRLAPVAKRPYLVFHDAYQYFERRYGLAPAGAIVVDPGRPSGARRLSTLRDRIETRDIGCLFVEPQFEPSIARSITEGTDVRIAELDPLGAGLTPGPTLYPELLKQLAGALRTCLMEQGAQSVTAH